MPEVARVGSLSLALNRNVPRVLIAFQFGCSFLVCFGIAGARAEEGIGLEDCIFIGDLSLLLALRVANLFN